MSVNIPILSGLKLLTFDTTKKFETTSNTSNYSSNYAPSFQTTQNYNPVITKQIELIINSPDSTIFSKKEASSSTDMSPKTSNTLPTYQSGSTIPASGDSSTNLDSGALVIGGALLIGGIFLYKGFKKGGKK